MSNGSKKAVRQVEEAWTQFYLAYVAHVAQLARPAVTAAPLAAAPVAAETVDHAAALAQAHAAAEARVAEAQRVAKAEIAAADERAARLAAESAAASQRTVLLEREIADERAKHEGLVATAVTAERKAATERTAAAVRTAVEEERLAAQARLAAAERAAAPKLSADPKPTVLPAPRAKADRPTLTLPVPVAPAVPPSVVEEPVVDIDDPTVPILVQRQLIRFIESVLQLDEPLKAGELKSEMTAVFRHVADELPFDRYKQALVDLTETGWERYGKKSLAEVAAYDVAAQDELQHTWNALRPLVGLKRIKGNLTAEHVAETIREYDQLRMTIDARAITLPQHHGLVIPPEVQHDAVERFALIPKLNPETPDLNAARFDLTADQFTKMTSSWHGIVIDDSNFSAVQRWTVLFAPHGHATMKADGQAFVAQLDGDTVVRIDHDELAVKRFLTLFTKKANLKDLEIKVNFPIRDQRQVTVVVEAWKLAQLFFLRKMSVTEVQGILQRAVYFNMRSVVTNAIQITDPLTTKAYELTIEEISRGRFRLRNIYGVKRVVR